MNPRVRRLLIPGTICLVCAALVAQDQVKQATKLVVATLKDADKAHAKALKELVGPATGALKETKAAAQSGASAPGDALSALGQTESALDFDLSDTTSTAVLVGVSIGVDDALTAAGLPLPPCAWIGTGSVIDKRLAHMQKVHNAAVAKGRKACWPILKAIGKQGDDAAMRTPDTPLPEFAPGFLDTNPSSDGADPVFVLPALQLTTLIGYSDGAASEDGALQISGFTRLTDDVLLSGNGPEDSGFGPVTVTPSADGRFEATITGLPEGNWRVVAKQPVAFAMDCVGIPGAPDPGTDQQTAAQVAKDAKLGWKQLAHDHGVALAKLSKDYKAALKAARKAIKGGADPEAVLDDVQAALETLQTVAESATNGATGVAATANATFGLKLGGLDQLVSEQLVGFGGANDKATARIEKNLRKLVARAVVQTRAFAHVLSKKAQWSLAADLEPIPYRRAAPVKGPALPALLPPLRFDLLTGQSRQGVSGDGVIRMRISGDGSLGPRANLGLFGPDGFFEFRDLLGSDLEGGLDLRFPDEGPGTLAEGNYVAVLQQGSVIVSAAISVPGTE
jgi:hypothetical protein